MKVWKVVMVGEVYEVRLFFVWYVDWDGDVNVR